MEDLKQKVESVLYAVGKKVTYEELARLCDSDVDSIKNILRELKEEYEERESALMLTEEADGWKLTVKEKFLPTVQNLIPETELPKSILETLAIIAWKQPVMQAEVVEIRSNKAYDHIAELLNMGFITKTRSGRTYEIKVTQKFKDYFDLPGQEEIKRLFEQFKQEKQQEKIGDLETYSEEEPKVTLLTDAHEKLDNLDVYNVPPEEQKEEEEEIEQAPEEKKQEIEAIFDGTEQTEDEEGMKKVKQILEDMDDNEEPETVEETEEDPEKKEEVEEKEEEEEQRDLPDELEEMIGPKSEEKEEEQDDSAS